MEQSSFSFPEYFDFPPFFTLQENKAVRDQQLSMWVTLVRQYCDFHSAAFISVDPTHELWSNTRIGRRLTSQEIVAVLDSLVSNGFGQWFDARKEKCTVFVRSVEQLANALEDWAKQTGSVGHVFTLYELREGPMTAGAAFHNVDATLFRLAVQRLEDRGKCAVIDEDGVKFV